MKWKPQATVSKGAGPTDRDLRVKPDELCALPFLSFHRCVLTTVEEGGGGGGKGRRGRRRRNPSRRKENRDRELARAGICPNSGITAALTKGSCFATGSCVTNIVFGKSHIPRSQVLSDDMSPPGLQAVLEGFCSSNLMCQQP